MRPASLKLFLQLRYQIAWFLSIRISSLRISSWFLCCFILHFPFFYRDIYRLLFFFSISNFYLFLRKVYCCFSSMPSYLWIKLNRLNIYVFFLLLYFHLRHISIPSLPSFLIISFCLSLVIMAARKLSSSPVFLSSPLPCLLLCLLLHWLNS